MPQALFACSIKARDKPWYMFDFYNGCIKKWEGNSTLTSFYYDAPRLVPSPFGIMPLRTNNEQKKCWILDTHTLI